MESTPSDNEMNGKLLAPYCFVQNHVMVITHRVSTWAFVNVDPSIILMLLTKSPSSDKDHIGILLAPFLFRSKPYYGLYM